MSNRKKSGSKFGFALLIIAIIALSVTALTMNNVFWMLLCGFACVVITAVASVLYFRKRYIETDHEQRGRIMLLEADLKRTQREKDAASAEVQRLKSENADLRVQSQEARGLASEIQVLREKQAALEKQIKQAGEDAAAKAKSGKPTQPTSPAANHAVLVHKPSVVPAQTVPSVTTSSKSVQGATPAPVVSPVQSMVNAPQSAAAAKPAAPQKQPPVRDASSPTPSSALLKLMKEIDDAAPGNTLPLTEDFDLSDVYYNDGWYNVREAICDYFPQYRSRFEDRSELIGEQIRRLMNEDFENGYAVWRWTVMHFQPLVADVSESFSIGEWAIEYLDDEACIKLMDRIEQDDPFFKALFTKVAYVGEGFIAFCAQCAAQMRHVLFDRLLDALLPRCKGGDAGHTQEKFLQKMMDHYQFEWSAQTKVIIQKHIAALSAGNSRNKTQTAFEKKWNEKLHYAGMEARRRMLGLTPPTAADPYVLSDTIDLAEYYREKDNCCVGVALCDYFPEIRESYGQNEYISFSSIIGELMEVDFDQAMKVWRWALCHFRSVIPADTGRELTNHVLYHTPRELRTRMLDEIEADSALAETLYGYGHFGVGSTELLLYCIRTGRFELFKRLYELHTKGAPPDNDSSTMEDFLEEAVSALGFAKPNAAQYEYFNGLVSDIPSKIKRELLQKRLQQLLPKEPAKPREHVSPPPERKKTPRTREPVRPADSADPTTLPNFYASYSVAGTMFAPRELLKTIQTGVRVNLVREPDNEYDDKAILVMDQGDNKLGYIPRTDNAKLSAAMDAGEAFYGLVFDTDMKVELPLIAIDVFREM